MAERKRSNAVQARVFARRLSPNGGCDAAIIGSWGGTPEQGQEARDELARQVFSPNRERGDGARRRTERRIFGQITDWNTNYQPSPIWGQGLAKNTKPN